MRFEKNRSPLPLGAGCRPCLPDEPPASMRSASSCRLRCADICHSTAGFGGRKEWQQRVRGGRRHRPLAAPATGGTAPGGGSPQWRCAPSGLTEQPYKKSSNAASDDYASIGSTSEPHFCLPALLAEREFRALATTCGDDATVMSQLASAAVLVELGILHHLR